MGKKLMIAHVFFRKYNTTSICKGKGTQCHVTILQRSLKGSVEQKQLQNWTAILQISDKTKGECNSQVTIKSDTLK